MKTPKMNYKPFSAREKRYVIKEGSSGNFEKDKEEYLKKRASLTRGQKYLFDIQQNEKAKKENLDKELIKEIDSEGSDYSVGVIVPSTKNGNESISKKDFTSRVIETKKEMSDLFGGTTSIEQVGSYTLKDGQLIEEKGVAVTSNTNKKNFEKNKSAILEYAHGKGKKWTQESMGVTVETPKHPAKSLHFIPTKD